MKPISLFTALTALFTTTFAADAALKNSSQEYYLKTEVKPGQTGKGRHDGLWIVDYHTGAGLADAVAVESKKGAAKGFLNGTVGTVGDITYQNQIFDRGNPFPWTLIPEPNTVFYTAWQPVRIDAGDGGTSQGSTDDGFWINGTGLQWTYDVKSKPDSSTNPFGGWLICDWWHGVPQLFFRINTYDDPAPSSCADVWLCPEYI